MAILDDVRAEVDGLRAKADDFYAAVDAALSTATVSAVAAVAPAAAPVLVSPELMEAIRDGVRRVREAHEDAVARIVQLIEQGGDTDRLRQVAVTWLSIGNGLDGVAADVGLDRMQTNLEWQGRAAEAYKAMVPAQGAQLGTLKEQCEALSTSLHDLGNQIDAFWLALLAAVVVMAAGFAVAIATAITVVGIPAACAAILTAVAAGATMITTAMVQVNALTTRIATEHQAMGQAAEEIRAGWPAPNTPALADASAADGDPSDWRPNR
ncbi:WXG100-like domain-containing protein [Actinomycetospora aeridis]|uniref:Outer membrane channel protein CpnT-like N-terminal domain-containing protein n=1 Tax=Actinomycetospora aeridis TaxID=3129231 RepID=A0ABU8N671_9PSEU